MEVFEAKFDYVKQRKDVLSFRKGDKFYIIDKPNGEWWNARKLSDDVFGYVPVVYLEKSKEQLIGRLVPEGRRNTREHDIHLQALAELHERVKPLPAHVLGQALGMDIPKEPVLPASHPSSNQRQKSNAAADRKDDSEEDEDELPAHLRTTPPPPVSSPPPPDYDVDDDEVDAFGVPYHHRLNTSGRFIELGDLDDEPPTMTPTSPPGLRPGVRMDENGLIQPKPLHNPVKESPVHRSLHRELRTSGRSVLEGNELKKVFRDRNDRKTLKQMEEDRNLRRTSLDVKLAERLQLGEERESMKNLQTLEKAATEPEFMKVKRKLHGGSGKT